MRFVGLPGPEHPGGVEFFVIEFQTFRGASAPDLAEGGDFVHAGGQPNSCKDFWQAKDS